MVKIVLRFFNEKERYFDRPTSFHAPSIPNRGDKIVIEEQGIAAVYMVHDRIFYDNETPDVNVVYVSTLTELNASKYSDINSSGESLESIVHL